MTTLTHRMRVLSHMEQRAREQQIEQQPQPSAEAMNAVAEIEEAEKRQADDPDDWMEWTPAYRRFIARKIDACFSGRTS